MQDLSWVCVWRFHNSWFRVWGLVFRAGLKFRLCGYRASCDHARTLSKLWSLFWTPFSVTRTLNTKPSALNPQWHLVLHPPPFFHTHVRLTCRISPGKRNSHCLDRIMERLLSLSEKHSLYNPSCGHIISLRRPQF